MVNLTGKSLVELLSLHSAVIEELRRRGIVRSANNPTGDFAEYLFCKAFGWTLQVNSKKACDAIGADGTRYQIKGRRLHKRNKSRQLSAIRDLEGFDILAAVLFNDNYGVTRAALIPASTVRSLATVDQYTNSHRFLLLEEVWNQPSVKDVTAEIDQVLKTAVTPPSA